MSKYGRLATEPHLPRIYHDILGPLSAAGHRIQMAQETALAESGHGLEYPGAGTDSVPITRYDQGHLYGRRRARVGHGNGSKWGGR